MRMLGPAGRGPAAGARRRRRLAQLAAAHAAESSRGKVVLVDFWTYSCINCLRALPYVKAWHERYKDHGLVVIGVHTPEFAFEKDEGNVRRAVQDLAVDLSGRARQRLRDLARLQQPLLARPLLHRRQRPDPRPSFRRGRIRRVRAPDPPAAARTRASRTCRRPSARIAGRRRSERRGQRQCRIARDLRRLRPRGELQFAGRIRARCSRRSTPCRTNCSATSGRSRAPGP